MTGPLRGEVRPWQLLGEHPDPAPPNTETLRGGRRLNRGADPMSTPTPRPMRLVTTPRTAEILRRCYRGENPAAVLERAARMLAGADGHLTTSGRIKPELKRKDAR